MTKPFQLWLPSEGTRSEQRQDPLTEVADYAAGYPQAAACHRYHNKKKRKCFLGALFDL